MLAGERRHLGIEDQRGAGSGNLVGGDAHADAGRAHEQAALGFSGDHGFGDGLRVVGVVRRFGRMGAEILEDHAPGLEMALEGFFKLEAAVVATDREHGFLLGCRGWMILFDETEKGRNALFNLVAAGHVDVEGTADRIADVLLIRVERVVEFAEEERLVGRLGMKQENGVHVPVGHPEDVVGFLHQLPGQHLAALLADVDADLAAGADGVMAGSLPVHGPDSGGENAEISPLPDRTPEDAFSHGAAADVPGADEKDGLHSKN